MTNECLQRRLWNVTVGNTVQACSAPARTWIRSQIDHNREVIMDIELHEDHTKGEVDAYLSQIQK